MERGQECIPNTFILFRKKYSKKYKRSRYSKKYKRSIKTTNVVDIVKSTNSKKYKQ
jgi:hypothetical protein